MKKSSGFTLLELMIVIAIIGILVAVAMPSMSVWRSRHRTWAAARDMQDAVRLARVSAIRNSANVLLSGNVNSAQHYTVSLDANGDGVGERVLRAGQLPAGVTLYAASNDGTVTFTRRGLATAVRTFQLRSDHPKHRFFSRISVNMAGRVLMERSATGADDSWEAVM